jgi:hypothetical protein
MTSERKIRANRANARASTGPKTAQGRARSAANALRHALSLSVYSDPLVSEEVETLAREIAGPDANAEIQDLARQIAEAQIDLRRVRYARHQFLTQTLAEPAGAPLGAPEKFVTSVPEGPHKFATILSQQAKQLLRMDRYERRALSRRKFAIRAFDEARRVRYCNNGRATLDCSKTILAERSQND